MDKFNFAVQIYGPLRTISPVLSQARVRIFYKYENRNGTYITDDFAEKLLSTLSYTPIVGIYDKDKGDFGDHGYNRETAQAYGVVPESPNVKWEKHKDEDGVEREYACADVFLWTARYKAASEIPNKSQSMELFDKSVRGRFDFINNKKLFVFEEGCFIGLTALGDDVEPCFEGSSFYSLKTSITELAEELRLFNLKETNQGGNKPVFNFKLSDGEKYEKIWAALNPNFNEAGNWTMEYSIMQVYDEYALVYNYEQGKYFRFNYTKDNDTNTVTIGDSIETFIMDVSEDEINALKALKSLNNDNFEKIDTVFSEKDSTISTLQGEKQTLETTLSSVNVELGEAKESVIELGNTIATYKQTETELNTQIANLTAENTALSEYKAAQVKELKDALYAQYASILKPEVMASVQEQFKDSDNLDELDKELAYKLVKSGDVFSLSNGFVPTGLTDKEDKLCGASKLIKKHMQNKANGGNK